MIRASELGVLYMALRILWAHGETLVVLRATVMV